MTKEVTDVQRIFSELELEVQVRLQSPPCQAVKQSNL